MNRHLAWIVAFAAAVFFLMSSGDEEAASSSEEGSLQEDSPAASVAPPAKADVVLRLPATKQNTAPLPPAMAEAVSASATESENSPTPAPESAATNADREPSSRQGARMPEVTAQIMDAMKRWMWAYGQGLNPQDPAFYDKLRRRSSSRAARTRYLRRTWSGQYYGIFSPLPDYHATTQFWITIQGDASEQGVQLTASEMTVNLQGDSGPRYSMRDFASPFKDRKPSPYIHLPAKVMTGLVPTTERCQEVVFLPFLAKTPTDTIDEFNGAVYCRVSRVGFEPLGLVSFYRAESSS